MRYNRVHFISIGGAAMHNLALDLADSGCTVTGSDDEIYEPALSSLRNAGLLPEAIGWHYEKITEDIDAVVLGMHARADNPELLKALELGIRIYSYPEFVYARSQHKKRIIIAGSHGKTTTTAMVMHVLRKLGIRTDYLLGAKLEGFDRMVRITDAPAIVIEGDEYLSSPIDRRPKIHHYRPHVAVITGIAWDHINVFPTFEDYVVQFKIFIDTIEQGGTLIYNQDDVEVSTLIKSARKDIRLIPYTSIQRGEGSDVVYNGAHYPVSIIGKHNLYNMNAARAVCNTFGISDADFFDAINDFKGASKRLQILSKNDKRTVFLDFAHAPSKVAATCTAVREWFGQQKLLAVLELHTFSSLNKEFIPEYKDSLNGADKAVVFYNAHTLEMKRMPSLDPDFLVHSFGHENFKVMTNEQLLFEYINQPEFRDYNILLMTSGNFNQMDLSLIK